MDYVSRGKMIVTFTYNCAEGAAKGITAGVQQTRPSAKGDEPITTRKYSKKITCDGTDRTKAIDTIGFHDMGFEQPGSGTAYARIWNEDREKPLAEAKGDFVW
ncbi:hypothetical protein ACQPW1_40520 [Nocardia sp. CA-128927]|uniref:hypothetical protein n=1 Tax=Nocardia sp. CA-128927 TaxID=3239975 RepID=UPI003D95CC99